MRVLVLHALQENSRRTNIEFCSSFSRHTFGHEIHYLNVMGLRAASSDALDNYDLALVTYEVLAYRDWVFWGELVERILRLTSTSTRTVLLPQDDYTFSVRLDELAMELVSPMIFSPLTEDLDKIYPKSIRRGVPIFPCYTGYFEQASFEAMKEFAKPFGERRIDLGQRVSDVPLHFGLEGIRKTQIAKRIAEEFKSRGFNVDVSTRREDAFLGDEWLRFLGDTKLTISRKGGSSLVDSRNKLRSRLALIGSLPLLSDVMKLRIASIGVAQVGRFSAESPRLFEAAAVGTVQILEEDSYLGGSFIPWIHYIPLARDFSNLGEIFKFISSPSSLIEISKSASKLLRDSGIFSYSAFVSSVFNRGLGAQHVVDGIGLVTDLDEQAGFSSQSELGLGSIRLRSLLNSPEKFKLLANKTYREEFLGMQRAFSQIEYLPESCFIPWVSLSEALRGS